MKISNNLELGARYRDVVTGFEGTATGFCTYITGCDQVLLTGPAGEDGGVKARWYDVDRLTRRLRTESPQPITLPREIVRNDPDGAAAQARARGPDMPAPIR